MERDALAPNTSSASRKTRSDESDLKLRILGLIPARGGSKGIPRKNLRPLLGRPLIVHTIQAALQSRFLGNVVVSTEDLEIANVAKEAGASVPFNRPKALATDAVPQIETVIDAIVRMEQIEGEPYDIAILLQPTVPMRSPDDIDAALELLVDSGSDSVVSFTRAMQCHPYYLYTLEKDRPVPFVNLPDQNLPRQNFPAVYVRNGAIYATRRDVIMEQRSFYGQDCRAYLMPPERSVNIDTLFDLNVAELLMRQRQGKHLEDANVQDSEYRT